MAQAVIRGFSQGDAEMAINRHGFELHRFVGVVTRATLALLVCMFGAGVASAASVNCTGTLTGTFDNIIVPAGRECDLGVATVNGSINVQAGAVLNMYGPATVKGSVSGNGSYAISVYNNPVAPPTAPTNKNAPVAGKSEVVAGNSILGNLNITNNGGTNVCGAFIGGNVFITGTQYELGFGGSEFGATCANYGGGNVVAGTVTIQNNNTSSFVTPPLTVADNVVGRSMSVSGNQGSANKNVLNNSVAGTLACFNNAAPFNAGGNSAAASTGQCANQEQQPPP